MPTKKGLAVWIFGFLTFLSILHTLDAVFSYLVGGTNSLLTLYPFYRMIHDKFGDINVLTYFWASITSAFILFGITSIFACQDPVMALINKVVSEAELEENQMDQHLESSLSALEMINHSLTANCIDLNEAKNTLKNVKGSVDTMKIEMMKLTAKLGNLEREMATPRKCPSCGKDILPEFKLCPYCGEELFLYKNIPALIRR